MTGIVLFDGTCAFCTRSVQFIAARDPVGYFRFGASRSVRASELLARFDVLDTTSRSIMLIEDGEIYFRSTAVLRIARRLTFPWRLAAALLWIPRPIRDAAYNAVAANRHRIAGPSNACDMPPPEIRARMI